LHVLHGSGETWLMCKAEGFVYNSQSLDPKAPL
jgi:hypothetical protein